MCDLDFLVHAHLVHIRSWHVDINFEPSFSIRELLPGRNAVELAWVKCLRSRSTEQMLSMPSSSSVRVLERHPKGHPGKQVHPHGDEGMQPCPAWLAHCVHSPEQDTDSLSVAAYKMIHKPKALENKCTTYLRTCFPTVIFFFSSGSTLTQTPRISQG